MLPTLGPFQHPDLSGKPLMCLPRMKCWWSRSPGSGSRRQGGC